MCPEEKKEIFDQAERLNNSAFKTFELAGIERTRAVFYIAGEALNDSRRSRVEIRDDRAIRRYLRWCVLVSLAQVSLLSRGGWS